MTLRLSTSFPTARRYIYIALLLLLIAGAVAIRNQPEQHSDAATRSPLGNHLTEEPQPNGDESRATESQQIISTITPSSVADGIKLRNNSAVATGFYKKTQAEEDSTGGTE